MKEAFRIKILGAVQGVGFRPFVYRLATELQITGCIKNSPQGVFIEAEGERHQLENFLLRLEKEKPSISSIHSLEYSVHDAIGYADFEILESETNGKKMAFIMPDIATCPDCLNEMFDAKNRRYQYPFINCTNCGPRFSIVESLPCDRPNTTMKNFKMCPECRQEYDDPNDRRFHAQPNACPNCGPHLELWDNQGNIIAAHHKALLKAIEAIRAGKILALKGIGGFQLMVDARNERAVQLLRERKHRSEKPLALMYHSLDAAKENCLISAMEDRLLTSPAAPIVLLSKKFEPDSPLSFGERPGLRLPPSVAPNNPYLGVMLPYSPLHHLLLRELNFPVVATSGNLSNEPICIDEHEALDRLGGITDFFLVHDRPITRQVDDSVVRVVCGREQVLRRTRGYAPLPLHLKNPAPPMLALGAHLKNTIAVSTGSEIFVSQHIGDLETAEAYFAFRKVIDDFKTLYEVDQIETICDLHPEYLSSKNAERHSVPVTQVQHHYAHVASCMLDNDLADPVLGVSWDGTGLGTDNTIWGGEFLLIHEKNYKRAAHFRTFPLPGGDAAVKQPCRTAIGLLYQIFGNNLFQNKKLLPVQHFPEQDLTLLKSMLERKLNAPATSSAGRLFDAVASIIGLRQKVSFEGQAAMELEFMIKGNIDDSYSFKIHEEQSYIIDWQPMIAEIIEDVENETDPGIIAVKFHNTLTEIIIAIAHKVNEPKVLLTGGCFQNKYLTERTVQRLKEEGFQPYWHQRIPPNDGGISAGQMMAAVLSKAQSANVIATPGIREKQFPDPGYKAKRRSKMKMTKI